MAESTQTFVLVGQFKDGITPSLRKLNTQINALTKTFGKFSKQLRPISKELGRMAMASERMARAQKTNRGIYEGNIRVMREYKKAIGDVGRAHTALSRKTPKSIRMPRPAPMVGGGGRRGDGGGLPMAAAMVAGERAGDKGLGFWGMTGAMFTANLAVQAATRGFQMLTNSLNGFVMGGAQAEQAVIQMSGTLMTLGKVGNFEKSRAMADSMMGDLGKVAAALPGSTEDYLSILQQTLDDQIEAFGTVEAVQKNLSGFDPKTGKKLAGGAEQSFTALMGMTAQLAGMRPEVAAMDLVQLRQNPENIRNVQLLTRNPTLAKFYKEELQKAGGNYILALNEAMKRAIPAEQIEALKNSFDSAYQSLLTTFTDKYGGIFGPMRKVTVMVTEMVDGVEKEVEKTMNAMEILGRIMRSINEIVGVLWGLVKDTPIDPMVMLVKALDEIGFQIYVFANDLMYLAEDFENGVAGVGDIAHLFGDAIGVAIANFTNWVLNLDYQQFFQTVDELVYGFFTGLFEGFMSAYTGIEAEHGGIFGGIGTSVSGTIVTLGLLGFAVAKILPVIATVGGFLLKLPTLIAGLATVFQVAAPMVMSFVTGIGSTLAAVAAPAALVVGGLLGLFAILRHGDFIMSSFWEGMKLLGNAFMWMIHVIQAWQAKLWAGLFRALSQIPMVGHIFKGAAEHAEKEAEKAEKRKQDRERAMAANAAKIADNTSKSFERTKEDFGKIGSAFQNFGKATQVETLSMAELSKQTTTLAGEAKKASSTFANNTQFEKSGKKFGWAMLNGKEVVVEWGSVAGTALKNVAAAADTANRSLSAVTPPETPTSGQTSEAPKPTRQQNRPGSGVRSRPPEASASVQLPATALTPVTTAVTTGTTATNQVQTAVQEAGTQITAAVAVPPPALTDAVTTLQSALVSAIDLVKEEVTKQSSAQMKKLDYLTTGINNVKSALFTISNKVATQGTLQQIANNTTKTNEMLASGKVKVSFNIVGGPKGGTPGAVDAFTPVATTQFGLQVTSGYRPGDPGYHGVNRARDYSNGSGPTPQMMAFAQYMASSFGPMLTELIYTPLGFGIKNGQVVPPYATANHYDHVHVALANGLEMPRLFTTAAAAANYESMMAPAGARVATVTANSSEFGGGGPVTLNQTVNVDGSGNPEATAEAVWRLTAKAVQQLQANNFGA